MENQPKQPVSRPYPLPPLPANRYYREPETLPAAGNRLELVEESDPFDRYSYRLRHIVHGGRTAFQDVLIADTYNYGPALFLDGAIQSSAEDEKLYHELLVQPAMLRHSAPRDVLILGGGEGATLREVLLHGAVRSCTMVDIDPELVELSRMHLRRWHRGAFDDPRARIVAADGRRFIEQDTGFYDIAIVDLVDLLDSGIAQPLYTRQFYERLKLRLRPGGIVAVQGLEFSFIDDKPHAALARTLRTVFSEVYSYREHIPSFLSAWGFIVGSDWFRPQDWSADEIDGAIATRLPPEALDHVDGAFLRARFALCKETRFMLAQAGPILEDGVAFVPPPDIEDVEPPSIAYPTSVR